MKTLEQIALLPCPFCGKSDTVEIIDSNTFQDLMPWDIEPEGNMVYWAVMCDASKPAGKGGCGASGGFMPTQEDAAEKWNARRLVAALGAQEPYGYLFYDKHMATQFSHQHPDAYEQFNMDCRPVFAAPICAVPDGWLEQYDIFVSDYNKYISGDPKLSFAELRESLAAFLQECERLAAAPEYKP